MEALEELVSDRGSAIEGPGRIHWILTVTYTKTRV